MGQHQNADLIKLVQGEKTTTNQGKKPNLIAPTQFNCMPFIFAPWIYVYSSKNPRALGGLTFVLVKKSLFVPVRAQFFLDYSNAFAC